jgi:hypothetical protein
LAHVAASSDEYAVKSYSAQPLLVSVWYAYSAGMGFVTAVAPYSDAAQPAASSTLLANSCTSYFRHAFPSSSPIVNVVACDPAIWPEHVVFTGQAPQSPGHDEHVSPLLQEWSPQYSHLPLTHAAPAGHTFPQAPQFDGSLIERQMPPQSFCAVLHPQVPREHAMPPLQAWPQLPQLDASFVKSTQAPLQLVPGQSAGQDEQFSPSLQVPSPHPEITHRPNHFPKYAPSMKSPSPAPPDS